MLCLIDDEVSHVGAKPDKRNIEQMISYIKGALGAVEDDVIVVETGGIGLAVHVPLSLLEELPALGEEVTVYTYFQVREDAMTLYGFLHRQDREMFKQLIGVNGIGPKGALGILLFSGRMICGAPVSAGMQKLFPRHRASAQRRPRD